MGTAKKKAPAKKAPAKKKASATRVLASILAELAQYSSFSAQRVRVGGQEMISYLVPDSPPVTAWVTVRGGVAFGTKAAGAAPPAELEAVLTTPVDPRPGVVAVEGARVGRFDRVLVVKTGHFVDAPLPAGVQLHWVLPCHRCEVPDGLPVDEFEFMLRRKLFAPLDWSRDPQPFLRARTSSPRKPWPGYRYRKELGASGFEHVAHALGEPAPAGAELEVESVSGEKTTFRSHAAGLLVGDDPTPIPRSAAAGALRSFLMRS